MSFFYEKHHHLNAAAGGIILSSSTISVVIPPVDISQYKTFSLMYQNNATATAFIDLQVQTAYDPTGSASDAADNWVQIPTATLPQPSALGTASCVITPPVTNVYKWIRVMGRVNNPASAGMFTLTIGGPRI